MTTENNDKQIFLTGLQGFATYAAVRVFVQALINGEKHEDTKLLRNVAAGAALVAAATHLYREYDAAKAAKNS